VRVDELGRGRELRADPRHSAEGVDGGADRLQVRPPRGTLVLPALVTAVTVSLASSTTSRPGPPGW
jgi:hypothetical protein